MDVLAIGTMTNTGCPFCGGATVSKNIRDTMNIATPQGGAIEITVEVPYETCPACDYKGYGEDGEHIRSEALYRGLREHGFMVINNKPVQRYAVEEILSQLDSMDWGFDKKNNKKNTGKYVTQQRTWDWVPGKKNRKSRK